MCWDSAEARLLLALAAWAVAAPAAAKDAEEDTREPIRIVYQAPAGCPDSTAFVQAVRRRSTRGRAANPLELARLFEVVVTRTASGTLVGTLVVGRGTPRAIPAEDCNELVEALALMTAVAIDRRQGEPLPPPPSPTVAPPPPSPPRALVGELAATPLPGPVPGPEPSPRRWRVGVGARGFAVAWLAPMPAGGGELFVDVRLEGLAGWAPALRLGVARTAPRRVDGELASASFTWTTGRLGACPLALALSRALEVSPCVAITAGVLDASGSTGPSPSDATRPWLALTLSGRLAFEPWRDVWLELELGPDLPLVRDRFLLVPGSVIYAVGSAGLWGAFGLGVRLP